MPPFWQYFSRLQAEGRRQASPSSPPKGTDPDACGLFPCKLAAFVGTTKRAKIAFIDPRRADAARWLGNEPSHAPVVAVLQAPAKKADETIAAPKGADPDPVGFVRANRPFLGEPGRAVITIVDTGKRRLDGGHQRHAEP
jgi:hypothetical protein